MTAKVDAPIEKQSLPSYNEKLHTAYSSLYLASFAASRMTPSPSMANFFAIGVGDVGQSYQTFQSLSDSKCKLAILIHPNLDAAIGLTLVFLSPTVQKIYGVARLLGMIVHSEQKIKSNWVNKKTNSEFYYKSMLVLFNLLPELVKTYCHFEMANRRAKLMEEWKSFFDDFENFKKSGKWESFYRNFEGFNTSRDVKSGCSTLKSGWEQASEISKLTDYHLNPSSVCDSLKALQVKTEPACEEAVQTASLFNRDKLTQACSSVCASVNRMYRKIAVQVHPDKHTQSMREQATTATENLNQFKETLIENYGCKTN